MGGQGSGGGRGYVYPVALTAEMKLGLIRLSTQFEDPDEFPTMLKIVRAGLLAYGAIDTTEIQSMRLRTNKNGEPIISDREIDFLVNKNLITDWRTHPTTTNTTADKNSKTKNKDGNGEIKERHWSQRLNLWSTTGPEQRVKWFKLALTEQDEYPSAKALVQLGLSENVTIPVEAKPLPENEKTVTYTLEASQVDKSKISWPKFAKNPIEENGQ